MPDLPAAGAAVKLLASGRDADVYELDEHRVLRRYRAGGDATGEAEVMAYLAGHGFPVPRVWQAQGPDLVMARVSGPTLLRAGLDGDVGFPEAAAMLADLHTRLHALPARHAVDPAQRILHLDIHPDNVILAAGGPVLIDWRNATEGPPDLDLAVTALILAEAAVGSHLAAEFAPAARELLVGFLARAGGDPTAQLDAAVARRAGDPALTSEEKARLAAAAALVKEP